MRILVLSDGPKKANFVASVLQYVGHSALLADSASDALLHTRYFNFDLAVLVLPLAGCHTIGRCLETCGCRILALHNGEFA
jgi:DNA-binding response OmpR family regulator